jgi:hypothetical protein
MTLSLHYTVKCLISCNAMARARVFQTQKIRHHRCTLGEYEGDGGLFIAMMALFEV